MDYRRHLLGATLLLFPLACASDDNPEPESSAETEGVDDDDGPGSTGTPSDTDEPGSTGTPEDTDDDSSGGSEPPTDCSCFLEPMEVQFTGCRDLDEVFPGCAEPTDDCGTFWRLDASFAEPDDDAPEEAVAALRCTLEALGAGERPGFTWAADPMDMYGGETEYLPLPDGTYGSYYCNTTNEGGHGVSVLDAGDAEGATACLGFLDVDPLTVEAYQDSLACLSDLVDDASGDVLAQCE